MRMFLAKWDAMYILKKTRTLQFWHAYHSISPLDKLKDTFSQENVPCHTTQICANCKVPKIADMSLCTEDISTS